MHPTLRARLARLGPITLLAVLSAVPQCIVPPSAHAVSPPPVDKTLLPAAAPPAPPRPTVQREVCTVPAFDPQRAGAPTQLDGLGLPAVWRLSRGAGQRVAVIDTGVAPHRRLPGLVAAGDYVSTGDGTQDCDGHGTLVAGIVAARPYSAADKFSGVAPDATVIAIRQSSTRFGAADDPSRVGVGDVDTLAAAVRTAADLGASVINISSVACAPVASGLDDRALGAALAYAVDVKNAVVVAAAGNTGDGQACPAQGDHAGGVTVAVSPAWYDDYVLTVGSVNGDGAPSAFTLPSPWVDVAAPGEAVLSLSPVGDATTNAADTVGSQRAPAPISGTSYAAPVVSGVAALVRSRFPAWSARQVMDRIRATAHRPPGGHDRFIGDGVVDPLAAVSADTPAPAAPGPVGAPPPLDVPPAAPTQEPSGRTAALTGAAALLAALALALTAHAAMGRLGSSRRPGVPGIDHVPGD
ncbi:MAG TPA: type VII secretion-associated serine protease mycosin [Mycobacterium sp.]|nr:type VII secretion-associated serine protease mycosin [Mycobacterium sp.]